MTEPPPLPFLDITESHASLPIWSQPGGILYVRYSFKGKEIQKFLGSILGNDVMTIVPYFALSTACFYLSMPTIPISDSISLGITLIWVISNILMIVKGARIIGNFWPSYDMRYRTLMKADYTESFLLTSNGIEVQNVSKTDFFPWHLIEKIEVRGGAVFLRGRKLSRYLFVLPSAFQSRRAADLFAEAAQALRLGEPAAPEALLQFPLPFQGAADATSPSA